MIQCFNTFSFCCGHVIQAVHHQNAAEGHFGNPSIVVHPYLKVLGKIFFAFHSKLCTSCTNKAHFNSFILSVSSNNMAVLINYKNNIQYIIKHKNLSMFSLFPFTANVLQENNCAIYIYCEIYSAYQICQSSTQQMDV